MSHRTRYSTVRGVEPDRATSLLAEAATSLPGPPPRNARWSDRTHVVKSKQMVALACADALVMADDAWPLAERIAKQLDAPHLELRIEESDHWDFTLYHRTHVVADFSTRVSYFDPDPGSPRPWKEGDAAAFSKHWNVPLERILPYLVDWDTLTTPRFAVDDDQYPAGDWQQIFDFMRAMGIADPFGHPDHFQVEVPGWVGTYIMQPLWRRTIRRISVWIKGTYPDVPRLTRDEREQWEQRRSSIGVQKVDLNGPDEVD